MKSIRFKFWDKFILLFNFCVLKSRKKTFAEYENIYEKGSNMVKNDLNMYTLLETLMKIKATLSVLVGHDSQRLKNIQL